MPAHSASHAALLPLALSPVRAGFPSPADDCMDASLNLQDYLVADPPATFMVRVQGDSMRDAGILDRDLLVVDKGLAPRHGDIVVAVVDGEFTVKRLHRKDGRCALLAANPAYPPIVPADGQELQIWGVATSCVRKWR
ncbi:translesion error-prone DNA polymerase V autoproteolytic subunit [Chromobacterium violaceum]|uniref:LexA family protein n=1 Tax=Chromobacterium violaceum TaxID=536 RepID=UPI001E52BD80|nr:translesion error-prone DNA polymerase V autoproteolytic subunit [Chromobacterium violaceum]MCD0494632.1 translesion error-prone DNA polymerase V autoproteolytic subunit [Chromobacterium violaceum]